MADPDPGSGPLDAAKAIRNACEMLLHPWKINLQPNGDIQRQKTMSAIRFLAYKDLASLSTALNDFAEYAKSDLSHWVAKPNQDPGTLPRLSDKHSRLWKDAATGLVVVPDERIPHLADYLLEVLENHKYLVGSRLNLPMTPRKIKSKRPTVGHSRSRTPESRHAPAASSDFPPSLTAKPTSRILFSTTKPSASGSDRSKAAQNEERRVQEMKRDTAGSTSIPHSKVKSSSRSNSTSTARRNSSNKRELSDDEVFLTPPASPHLAPQVADSLVEYPIVTHEQGTDNILTDPPSHQHSGPSAKRSSVSTSRHGDIRSFFSPRICGASPRPTPTLTSSVTNSFSSTESSSEPTTAQTSFQSEGVVQNEDVPMDDFDFSDEDFDLLGDSDSFHVDSSLLERLGTHSPLKPQASSQMKSLSYRARYEVTRVSEEFKIQPGELLARYDAPRQDDTYLWSYLSRRVKDLRGEACLMPERTAPEVFSLATDNFKNNDSRVVYQQGKLVWAEKGNSEGGPVFDLKLRPLSLGTSRRLYRKFGADRFLLLGLPSLQPGALPPHISRTGQNGVNSILKWLVETDHVFCNRTWKAFYVDDIKKAKKGDSQHRVCLFAIDGADFGSKDPLVMPAMKEMVKHSPVSIYQLVDWLVPIKHNRKSKMLKLFQRIQLGMSQTYPTAILGSAPGQVRRVEDIRNDKDKGMVMNDGCARMSWYLGKDIADALGLQTVPSVYQGRFAGSKGLWVVEPYDPSQKKKGSWIEISDSQLKIKPHPADTGYYERDRNDEHIRTFEVLKHSGPLSTASLNHQIITILHHGGVPWSVFRKLVIATASDQRRFFDTSMANPLEAKRVIDLISPVRNQRLINGGVLTRGSWPISSAERINLLLDSGFRGDKCRELKDALMGEVETFVFTMQEKLNIKLADSTFVYCLADPFNVLEEDEVFISFSRPFENSDEKTQLHDLTGLEVLVARLPAHLPSDIQKRKAVWNPKLSHIKDVIIFSVKGLVPTAHELSGGDYDGDITWLCWDDEIVRSFHSTPTPTEQPTIESFGGRKNETLMSEIFPEKQGPAFDVDIAMNDFMLRCFAFNTGPNLLGQVSNFIDKYCYWFNTISSVPAIKTSFLAGLLVDAKKQGYVLPEESWRDYQKSLCPKHLKTPAYKLETKKQEDKLPLDDSKLLDHLKRVTIGENFRIFAETHDQWKNVPSKDEDLSKIWLDEMGQARKKADAGQPALLEILTDLEARVEQLNVRWNERRARAKSRISSSSSDEVPNFGERVTASFEELQQILPKDVAVCDHPQPCMQCGQRNHVDLVNRWRDEARSGKHCYWARLRASCVFTRYQSSSFPWYMAGTELCSIKAESKGKSRLVVEDILKVMKPDSKIIRRVTGAMDNDLLVDTLDDSNDVFDDGELVALTENLEIAE